MGLSRLAILVAALLPGVLAAAGPATAQESTASYRPYSHPRYHIGVAGITALATDGRWDGADPSTGVLVRGGYRFHPNLAFEFQGEWHSRFDDDEHWTAWAVMGQARGYLLRGRTQPYLLAGLGVIQARDGGDGSSSADLGGAPRAGVGLDWYATKTIALSLDVSYTIPFGDPDDYDFLSISWGIQWH